MEMDLPALVSTFQDHFGAGPTPAAVRAPGRVNLIGEHTDYNDGFVLPIAIDRQIVALVRPRPDRLVRLRSTGEAAPAEVDLDATIVRGEPKWANYCRGVLAGLLQRAQKLRGADILFHSTIPLGAGLSSSAALEVATALAMQTAAGTLGSIPPAELARLCQQAEHIYAGTPCGIMDQSIVISGQAGHALLLDCRSLAMRQVPFDDPDLVLLVCDTQVRHELNDGGYAARRAQCDSAARKLHVPALRCATPEQLAQCGELTNVERKRATHVIGEIALTVEAVEALEQGLYGRFGELMYHSHASLRDDYEVSCPELDEVVAIAACQDGVYGARMTGGGFGGCAIVLAAADRSRAVAEAIQNGFALRFARRCPVFATRAADGAGPIATN